MNTHTQVRQYITHSVLNIPVSSFLSKRQTIHTFPSISLSFLLSKPSVLQLSMIVPGKEEPQYREDGGGP